jgi:hypothetical protein
MPRMPPLADLNGLAGAAVVIAAVAVAAGRTVGLRRSHLALLGGVSAVAALAPIGALPLAGSLRGVVGDLSFTTLVLLLSSLHRHVQGGEPINARSTFALQLLAAIGGLVLYPLALGFGAWDPYRLGYGDPWFLAALLAVALTALLLDLPLVTFGIALGVLAWALGAYESRNLWDYLLDPFVFVWSLSTFLLRGASVLVRGHRRATDEQLRIRAESSS